VFRRLHEGVWSLTLKWLKKNENKTTYVWMTEKLERVYRLWVEKCKSTCECGLYSHNLVVCLCMTKKLNNNPHNDDFQDVELESSILSKFKL
jgi:hypothetical protein